MTTLDDIQYVRDVTEALDEVSVELYKAMAQFPPLNSPHEGHGVIREEMHELWDHVRADTGRSAEARHEAVQVAAMAVRYMIELTVK